MIKFSARPEPDDAAKRGLDAGEIHIWILNTDCLADADLMRSCLSALSPDERNGIAGLKTELLRRRNIGTRALIRLALSHTFPREPSSWAFGKDAYDRPFLEGKELDLVDFNISHANAWTVCALTSGGRIGIDVESKNRSADLFEIARIFLSARELADLGMLSTDEAADRLVQCWTVKEAIVKAIGMGLSFPMNSISLTFGSNPPIAEFEEPAFDADMRLFVSNENVDDYHTLSLAALRSDPAEPEVLVLDGRNLL